MIRDIKYAAAAIMTMALVGTPVSLAATGGLVYIPLGSAGEVLVVDAEQNAAVGKIGGLPAVHGLAGTPDGHYLIAGSYEEREAGSEVVVRPPAVSEDEHNIHHLRSQGRSAQITSTMISTVSVVETADGSVVRRIDVPGAGHHVAVSPEGGFAVVTHPNEGAISAIDLRSYEVIATVATGLSPNYATFSPDGGEVFVSNAGNNTVSAVDTKRWIVRWNTLVGNSPEHVVLSKDGALLYVNNVDEGTVSVVAVAERDVVRTISVGSTPHGIDLSDDGSTLFVADLGEDKLISIDLANDDRRSVLLAPAPYHLAVVRGSDKLYVSSADEPKIWVVDQKSLAVIGEIPIGGKGHQMVQGAGT